MPVSSFFALLDAVARKSIAVADDVAVAAGPVARTTATMTGKATGIVVDDIAVTSTGLGGMSQEREIPVVAKIAAGSFFVNKVPTIGILIAANTVTPLVGTTLLVVGGAYLAYEGSHEIQHAIQQWRRKGTADAGPHGKTPHQEQPLDPAADKPKPNGIAERFANSAVGKRLERWLGPPNEKKLITDLLTKDFILSAEIIVVSLGMATTAGFLGASAALPLLGVAAATTVGVYGTVMGLVRADNVAAHFAKAKGDSARARLSRAVGNGVVKGLPYLMKGISAIGIFAMTAIGGEIVAHGLGLHLPGLDQKNMLGTFAAFGYGLAGGSVLMAGKMAGEKIWRTINPPKAPPPAPPGDAPTADGPAADGPKPADPAPAAGNDPTAQAKPVGNHPKDTPVTGPFDPPAAGPSSPTPARRIP